MAFSPDGVSAYVTNLQNESIVQFNTADESEDGVINLSYGPTWSRVNQTTGTIYADRPYNVDSNIPAIFQFTVIATGVQTVTTSEIPANLAVTANGAYLYVPFAHASTTQTGNTVVMLTRRPSHPWGIRLWSATSLSSWRCLRTVTMRTSVISPTVLSR